VPPRGAECVSSFCVAPCRQRGEPGIGRWRLPACGSSPSCPKYRS
jgi:hypothetical protein